MIDFEKQLQRQPMRPIPAAWRAEILAAAQPAPAPSLSTLLSHLSTLFQPYPKAWGALAAVWVVILGINFANYESAPAMEASAKPPLKEMVLALQNQRLLRAELIGGQESEPVDRPKTKPQPRSETTSGEAVV